MSKEKFKFTPDMLEDYLYIAVCRSMQLRLSQAKIVVYGNQKENTFDIHCVFPNCGAIGVIIDKKLKVETIDGKPFEVLLEVMRDLVRDIINELDEELDNEQ